MENVCESRAQMHSTDGQRVTSEKMFNTRQLMFLPAVVWLHLRLERSWRHCSYKGKDDLRAGESHQSPTDHDEVKNVPQVTKIRARVEEQSQVNHLESQNKQQQNNFKKQATS